MSPVNFRLLLVTERHQLHDRPLSTVLSQAITAGVPAIQLRERDLPIGELLSLAQEIQSITTSCAVPLIVNDRVDLMMALNLDGGLSLDPPQPWLLRRPCRCGDEYLLRNPCSAMVRRR